MPSEQEVREVLKDILDPELMLSIVDLGLIYAVEVHGERVTVKMTLTSPVCPYGPHLVESVQRMVSMLQGVSECNVEVVWRPPWDPKTMASDEVKLLLGLM